MGLVCIAEVVSGPLVCVMPEPKLICVGHRFRHPDTQKAQNLLSHRHILDLTSCAYNDHHIYTINVALFMIRHFTQDQ